MKYLLRRKFSQEFFILSNCVFLWSWRYLINRDLIWKVVFNGFMYCINKSLWPIFRHVKTLGYPFPLSTPLRVLIGSADEPLLKDWWCVTRSQVRLVPLGWLDYSFFSVKDLHVLCGGRLGVFGQTLKGCSETDSYADVNPSYLLYYSEWSTVSQL